ncbi:hypothetical protein RA27_00250 [Ruegeria sp. ANG-R]|uniref:imm11 family protein n=1 Tax=Ruegeria sp. ANG-R TaxID=1577903 RepID=UPI0005806732|nr:DUF1629 domain-containing protein [Ruegeria sp. ANG-R]KIC41890.1 hypothetical protein RA27_00250 [Ruegeria sp. ANG-R]
MTWLILPQQPSCENLGYSFRVTAGLSEYWHNKDDARIFRSVGLGSQLVTKRNLPRSRNPDTAFDPVNLPIAFKLMCYDADGKNVPLEEAGGKFPDVIFGAGGNYFVSDRFRLILDGVAPGAVHFEKVKLSGPKFAILEQDWYLMMFREFADVLLEDRSNLISIYRRWAGWDLADHDQDPKLYAKRSSVSGYRFWSGIRNERTAPCNVASPGFTYCSDEVMEKLQAENVTGLGPAYEVTLLDDGDTATVATGAPKLFEGVYEPSDTTFVIPWIRSAETGGAPSNADSSVRDTDAVIRLSARTQKKYTDFFRDSSRLLASPKAQDVLRRFAANDVTFTPVTFVQTQFSEGFPQPEGYCVVTPKILRPFIPEISKKISAGIRLTGQLGLDAFDPDVVDKAQLENSLFWKDEQGSYYFSSNLWSEIENAKLTGLERVGEGVALRKA